MSSRFNLINVLFISVFILFASAQNAYAYLDPGTGSYIFQIIIAVALGGLFAIKLLWNKIITFLKKIFGKNKN